MASHTMPPSTVALFCVLTILQAPAFADVRYSYVDVKRVIVDGDMQIAFTLPAYATQKIYCPGNLLKILPGTDAPDSLRLYDARGRIFRYDPSRRLFPLETRTSDKSRLSGDYIYMDGAPQIPVTVTCGPVPRSPKIIKDETFIYTAGSQDAQGPCTLVSTDGNYAYYDCGRGYFPPYGCRETPSARICYSPGDSAIDWPLMDEAIPGTSDSFHSGSGFGENKNFAKRLAMLNETAARGNPFYEQKRKPRAAAASAAPSQSATQTTSSAQGVASQEERPSSATFSSNAKLIIGLILLIGGLLSIFLMPKAG